MLEIVATKKQELTGILATVSSELLDSLKNSDADNSTTKKEIIDLISTNSARNSINGSMLTQARNMTEKSIGILLSCTDRAPVEIYDEQGKVPDPGKKRALGAA